MSKKVSYGATGFFLIILLIFIGTLSPFLTYICFLLSCEVSIWISTYFYNHPSYECCVGIILLLLSQNLCIGIGAHIASNQTDSLKLLTQIPFLTIFFIWINIFAHNARKLTNRREKLFVLFLILIAGSLLFGHGTINSILINARNMTCFYMAFEIGYVNMPTERVIGKYQKRINTISFWVLIIGVVLLIGGFPFYKAIGIEEVYFAKGSPLSGGFDDRFTTSLIKREYVRMGSVYYEPVNMGYYFGAVFLGCVFLPWTKSRKKRILCSILSLIGLVLTVGKGAYLLVAGTLLCVLFYRIFRVLFLHFGRKRTRRVVIIIGLIVLVSFCIYYYRNIGAAASPHFWGVMQTWNSVLRRPFGYGLGTGGNMGQLFNKGNDNVFSAFSTGAETAFMSFLYQIGIQGGIVLLLLMMNLCVSGKEHIRNNSIYDIYFFLPIMILAVSFLQDNTFTPQCIVPYMLIQGGAKRIYNNGKR